MQMRVCLLHLHTSCSDDMFQFQSSSSKRTAKFIHVFDFECLKPTPRQIAVDASHFPSNHQPAKSDPTLQQLRPCRTAIPCHSIVSVHSGDKHEARAISWCFRHLKTRSSSTITFDVNASTSMMEDGGTVCVCVCARHDVRFDVLFPMPLINYLGGFLAA